MNDPSKTGSSPKTHYIAEWVKKDAYVGVLIVLLGTHGIYDLDEKNYCFFRRKFQDLKISRERDKNAKICVILTVAMPIMWF